MIEFQNVSKYYRNNPAVCGLSLHIEEGETFGLIGTSGCGKTTTLKLINRLVDPTSGNIRVNGKDNGSVPLAELRRSIGYVIQDGGLFPHYSVEENIAIVPHLLGWNEDEIQSRNRELLEMVGLEADTFAARMPGSLSGGQQQRIGIARALAADPPIILMDEPFGALDPITKREIRSEVTQIFEHISKTIVLVTHDVFEAFEMCDRLCLLDEGKIQQVGSPKELLFRPVNDFGRSFFEDNRFQLEMYSITIGDIYQTICQSDKIESSAFGNRDSGLELSEECLSAVKRSTPFFQALKQAENDYVWLVGEDYEPIAQLSNEQLLEGFQEVCRKLRGRGE